MTEKQLIVAINKFIDGVADDDKFELPVDNSIKGARYIHYPSLPALDGDGKINCLQVLTISNGGFKIIFNLNRKLFSLNTYSPRPVMDDIADPELFKRYVKGYVTLGEFWLFNEYFK